MNECGVRIGGVEEAGERHTHTHREGERGKCPKPSLLELHRDVAREYNIYNTETETLVSLSPFDVGQCVTHLFVCCIIQTNCRRGF